MLQSSPFNVLVPRNAAESSWLLFNTLYSSLAELNDEGRARYDDLVSGGATESSDEVAEELFAGRFLSETAADERDWLKAATLRDMNDDSTLALCIAPTLACNLRCIYCYEEHESVTMTPEIIEGIEAFVEARFKRHPFRELSVLWYGGEPMLAYDVIATLSQWFIDWCDAHDVAYKASMISNATLIDEETARRLFDWGVVSIMPTLDGKAESHDGKRRRADGGGSFEETLRGIRACAKAGMRVGINCSLDRTNIDEYRRLRECFADEDAVDIYASQLRNYHDWCAHCDPNVCPAPALLGRTEYARALFDLYRETEPSAAGVYQSLRPRRIFCRGQIASYFVIDPRGDVTNCDGFMGDPDHRLFNVCDREYELDWPRTTVPWDNDRCQNCALVPLCQGDCQWEWSMFDQNCSALRSTIGDYLNLLRDRLDDPDPSAAVTLYLPPRAIDEDYATPVHPFLEAVMGR